MKYLKALASWAALASFAVALPAFAQSTGTVDLYGSANASAAVGVPSTTVNAAVGEASSGDASASSANVTAETDVSGSSSSGTAPASANQNAGYNTLNGTMSVGTAGALGASSSGPTFVITRQDVAATTTGYITPSNVTTADDFAAYSRALMMTDENIQKVAANDNQISVWYREPAKLLGIVPVAVTVQATVDASGSVAVNYPWWYGIFVKDSAQAQFRSDLDNTAGTIARGEATTTLSSSAKARIVNALQSILKARYQSTSGTTTSETTAY